jgi:Ca2+-binding RTX toxin-like protein
MKDFGKQARSRLRFMLSGLWLPLLLATLLSVAIPQIALAAVTSTVVSGVLTVSSDNADPITLVCDASFVKINGTDPGSGAAACNTIISITVTGGPGDNTIDLSTVTAVDFSSLTSITLNGGNANDTITGSGLVDTLNGDGGDDTLVGAKGDDTMNGGAGNDTLIWNNGDNSDTMNGDGDADQVAVNGAAVGDIFAIAPNGARVAFTRTNLIPFTLNISAEALVVNGGEGDDVVTGTVGLKDLIALTLNGGNGNDRLTGGDGVDTLNGDGGDDTLVGAKGDDTMNGGAGNDTLIWNNGDNSDTMNGDGDADQVAVNGAAVGDIFTIAPNGARVAFTRTNLIPFTLNISAEALVVNGGEGDDVVTGTVGLKDLIALTLNGGNGNDRLTGGDGVDTLNGDGGDDTLVGAKGDDTMNGGAGNDTLIWNNGDNSDTMNGDGDADQVAVNGAAVGDIFTIAPNGARVAFTRTNLIPFTLNISAEALVVNGGEGDDVVTGTVGLKDLIALTLNGGNGNDRLTGGDGVDTLNGDGGDDTLVGAKGDDTMNGGAGNDTLIWNNGDNSDTMNGDGDADQVAVNGAAVGDIFTIAPNGARVAFTRTNLIPFTLNISAEALVVNGGGGEDIFNVQPLPETTLLINGGPEVTSSDSHGNEAGNGDELLVDAQNRSVAVGSDSVQVQGAKVIQYTGIERLEILNRIYSLYLPLTLKSY